MLKAAQKKALSILRREPPLTPGEFDLNALPTLLGKDDPVILDIGCNHGEHTLEFLRLFKASKVYAFEPDPRALDGFRSMVKNERAKLFDFAISDKDGTTEFHVSDGLHPWPKWKEVRSTGWDLSGSIKKPKRHLEVYPWCTFNDSITVKTKRLDTWCREEGIESIDFIWADVQGAEENLIKGGQEALNRTRYFYTEFSNQELYEGQISLREIVKLLLDFEIVYRFSNDVLFKNKWWRTNHNSYLKFRSRSHDTMIRLDDEAGNVIETHEHAVEVKKP
jgi:2-O-methyltransferase